MPDEFDIRLRDADAGGRLRASPAKTRLDCPCGEHIEGEDQEDLLSMTRRHLAEKHPQLLDVYGREHILFIAY